MGFFADKVQKAAKRRAEKRPDRPVLLEKARWNEKLHPRGPDGRFVSSGGGGGIISDLLSGGGAPSGGGRKRPPSDLDGEVKEGPFGEVTYTGTVHVDTSGGSFHQEGRDRQVAQVQGIDPERGTAAVRYELDPDHPAVQDAVADMGDEMSVDEMEFVEYVPLDKVYANNDTVPLSDVDFGDFRPPSQPPGGGDPGPRGPDPDARYRGVNGEDLGDFDPEYTPGSDNGRGVPRSDLPGRTFTGPDGDGYVFEGVIGQRSDGTWVVEAPVDDSISEADPDSDDYAPDYFEFRPDGTVVNLSDPTQPENDPDQTPGEVRGMQAISDAIDSVSEMREGDAIELSTPDDDALAFVVHEGDHYEFGDGDVTDGGDADDARAFLDEWRDRLLEGTVGDPDGTTLSRSWDDDDAEGPGDGGGGYRDPADDVESPEAPTPTPPDSYKDLGKRPRKGTRVEDTFEPGRYGVTASRVSSDGFEYGADVDWDDGERTWSPLEMLAPSDAPAYSGEAPGGGDTGAERALNSIGDYEMKTVLVDGKPTVIERQPGDKGRGLFGESVAVQGEWEVPYTLQTKDEIQESWSGKDVQTFESWNELLRATDTEALEEFIDGDDLPYAQHMDVQEELDRRAGKAERLSPNFAQMSTEALEAYVARGGPDADNAMRILRARRAKAINRGAGARRDSVTPSGKPRDQGVGPGSGNTDVGPGSGSVRKALEKVYESREQRRIQ